MSLAFTPVGDNPRASNAAAAALLALGLSPSGVKARLIYTSDPPQDPSNPELWGGVFNFRRAVFRPRNSTVSFGGNRFLEHVVTVSNPTEEIFIHKCLPQRNPNPGNDSDGDSGVIDDDF